MKTEVQLDLFGGDPKHYRIHKPKDVPEPKARQLDLIPGLNDLPGQLVMFREPGMPDDLVIERCQDCSGGWLCKKCQQAGLVRDRQRAEAVRSASESHRYSEIARLAAQLELESDEFTTAEEKAIFIKGEKP